MHGTINIKYYLIIHEPSSASLLEPEISQLDSKRIFQAEDEHYPYRDSVGYSPICLSGGLFSIPGHSLWDY